MKKNINKTIGVLFLLVSLLVSPSTMAATTDFTADADITVDSVSYNDGAGTATALILDTSTTESWSFDDTGQMTVTNPGTFRVGSSSSTMTDIHTTLDGSKVACTLNSTPGTSYVEVATTAGVYTIVFNSPDYDNVLTFNAECGASTCDSGYHISGSGQTAVCAVNRSSGSSGSTTTTTTTTTETTEPEETEEVTTTEDVVETTEPELDESGNVTLDQMVDDATVVVSNDVDQVLVKMGLTRDISQETTYSETVVSQVVGDSEVTSDVRNNIINFVTYGTKSTKILGAGERGGVVNSFQAAFGKLPTTLEDWNDVIKIGNGRWPSQVSETGQVRANINFRAIYKRDADMSNQNDNAAITVMTYGLRPANRNLDSEKVAIKTFKAVFGYYPSAATAWDAVRAIAYSGATR